MIVFLFKYLPLKFLISKILLCPLDYQIFIRYSKDGAEIVSTCWRNKRSQTNNGNSAPHKPISQSIGHKKEIIVIVTVLLITGLLLALLEFNFLALKAPISVYIGIDVGYGDENTIYKLVDEVAGYVNLIIIGSSQVTIDTTKLTNVCNYLYEKNLSFIIYVGFGNESCTIPTGPNPQFFQMAADRYGKKFLGAYIFDEIGGKQIDRPANKTKPKPVPAADNFTDAAQKFVTTINASLNEVTRYYSQTQCKIFTSDYALFWYDYLAGYDAVFTEFGSNQSRQIPIALCRGAAKTLNKEWGTIITWRYSQPPFLETPVELYGDMVLAYQSGAKYIIVFDSPENETGYLVLTHQHLDYIQKFWNYAKSHSQPIKDPVETAYVLPKDYGYGFRRPDDSIWGLWPPDNLSLVVWETPNNLIVNQGKSLDIVYENKIDDTSITLAYGELFYWNGTIIKNML